MEKFKNEGFIITYESMKISKFVQRKLEALLALDIIEARGIDLDLEQIILRYVTNSDVTAYRIIYRLLNEKLIETEDKELDSEVINKVKEALNRAKVRKGPYVGFTIGNTTKLVFKSYKEQRGKNYIRWKLTEKGKKTLIDGLRKLGFSEDEIKSLLNSNPLAAVGDIRLRIVQYLDETSEIESLQRYSHLLGDTTKLITDVSAGKIFVKTALKVLRPDETYEPKAGFAISFARDEDLLANELIKINLWKDLNVNYLNPLITNFRDYLVKFSIAMLNPVSYNEITEHLKRIVNWPSLAERGNAQKVDAYLDSAIKSGYIIRKGNLLEFVDPFIANANSPRSILEYLNEAYFAGTILYSGMLSIPINEKQLKIRGFEINFYRSIYTITATLLWQTTYSYPLPIIAEKRDNGLEIKTDEWYKELENIPGDLVNKSAFVKTILDMDKSIAKRVISSYVTEFIKKLENGHLLRLIGSKPPYYLVPYGIHTKLTNVFRDETSNTVVETVKAIAKVIAQYSRKTGNPYMITKEELIKVFKEYSIYEPLIQKLQQEGILLNVGGSYIITPYSLPGIYLDLLKGPSNIIHAQNFSIPLLELLYKVPNEDRQVFQQFLEELIEHEKIGVSDFSKDIVYKSSNPIKLIEAYKFIQGWGLIEDKNNEIYVSPNFNNGNFGAKTILVILKELLGWKEELEGLSNNEIKLIKDFSRAETNNEIEQIIHDYQKKSQYTEEVYDKKNYDSKE